MKKITNVETEALVDIAQLVSEYAFGKLKKRAPDGANRTAFQPPEG